MAAASASADETSDAVKALPPDADHESVTSLDAIGEATLYRPSLKNGRPGPYRIVVLRSAEPKSTRLFVQHISGRGVATSIEVAEFSRLGVDIADLRAKAESGGLSVFIDVEPKGDLSYELFMTGPQKYRFSQATN